MYDYIYANGDSFTAGRDLADFLYVPDYPLQTFSSWIKNIGYVEKQGEKYLKKQGQSMNQHIAPLERRMSFVAKLSELTDTPYWNNAISGNSTANTALNTYKDLLYLNEKRKGQRILVLIGLTNAGRLWFPNPKNPSNTLILNRSTGFKHREEKIISDWYVRHSNHTDLHLIMANQLNGIITFSENLDLDIDLYFVGNPLFCHRHFDEITGDSYKPIVDIIKSRTIDILGGEDIHEHFEEERFSSSGHLPIADHERLAQRLKDKLWT